MTASVASLPVILLTSDVAASQAADEEAPRWSSRPHRDSHLADRLASDRRLGQIALLQRGAFAPGTLAWLSAHARGKWRPEAPESVPWREARRESKKSQHELFSS